MLPGGHAAYSQVWVLWKSARNCLNFAVHCSTYLKIHDLEFLGSQWAAQVVLVAAYVELLLCSYTVMKSLMRFSSAALIGKKFHPKARQ